MAEGANTPTSGRGSGVASGAATGAAAGFMVGGPIGAVAGGFIGAAAGFISGASADKAGYYRNLAYKTNKQLVNRQASIQRRDMLREFRLRRAATMTAIGSEEGGTRSSAPMNAVGSLGAQFAFNDAYFARDYALKKQYAKYMKQAGRAADSAAVTMATFNTVASAVSSFGSPKPDAPTGSPTLSSVGPYQTGYQGFQMPTSPTYQTMSNLLPSLYGP